MTLRAFIFRAAPAALASLLAACAHQSRLPPVQQAPAAAASSAATVPAISLPAEQRRLAELFRGTPVVIQLTPEGWLRVDVPNEFCFDKGRAVVNPPLAKVLDHVAASAKSPGMKARVLASSDGHGGTIAQERAASTRDYLVGKGVPVSHFATLGAGSPAGTIEIVVGRL